jgi:hypothetical protein
LIRRIIALLTSRIIAHILLVGKPKWRMLFPWEVAQQQRYYNGDCLRVDTAVVPLIQYK